MVKALTTCDNRIFKRFYSIIHIVFATYFSHDPYAFDLHSREL